jgi:hypothetical protein
MAKAGLTKEDALIVGCKVGAGVGGALGVTGAWDGGSVFNLLEDGQTQPSSSNAIASIAAVAPAHWSSVQLVEPVPYKDALTTPQERKTVDKDPGSGIPPKCSMGQQPVFSTGRKLQGMYAVPFTRWVQGP